MENRSNIDTRPLWRQSGGPRSIQEAKLVLFGGGWKGSGRLLGVSWASPGSKASLGSLLAASWAVFGRCSTRLGRPLGSSWAVLGTKLGHLGCSWRQLGGVLVGFSHQDGAKLVSKSFKLWFWCLNCSNAENYYFPCIILMLFEVLGSKLGGKLEPRATKNW